MGKWEMGNHGWPRRKPVAKDSSAFYTVLGDTKLLLFFCIGLNYILLFYLSFFRFSFFFSPMIRRSTSCVVAAVTASPPLLPARFSQDSTFRPFRLTTVRTDFYDDNCCRDALLSLSLYFLLLVSGRPQRGKSESLSTGWREEKEEEEEENKNETRGMVDMENNEK